MPGSIDSNGIYIYAEDDDIDAWSDVMNYGQEATSDAIGLLKGRATTTETELGRRVRIYTMPPGENQEEFFPTPSTFAGRLALQKSGAYLHYESNSKLYRFWAEDDSDEGVSVNSEGRTPYGWYDINDRQTGYFNANTDAAGLCVVSHTLGKKPFVFTTLLDSAGIAGRVNLIITAREVDSFTMKAIRSDTGAAIASANVKFHWMAIVPDFQP